MSATAKSLFQSDGNDRWDDPQPPSRRTTQSRAVCFVTDRLRDVDRVIPKHRPDLG